MLQQVTHKTKLFNFNQLFLAHHIRFYRRVRIFGISASAILTVIMTLTVFPLVNHTHIAEAAPNVAVASDTVITFTSTLPSANLSLVVKSAGGTFASSSDSESSKFSITTNNYTGYTLSITGPENTDLTNEDTDKVFSSVQIATDAYTFENGSGSMYNGKWGYKPNQYYDDANNKVVINNDFLPSPTKLASTTLDITKSANSESNNYSIALGARADYSTPNGVYSNTFILTLVANNISYTLNFTDTTGDVSVSGLPSTETSTTTETKVKLPTNIPTRTGYTFAGWCDVEPTVLDNGSTSCIDASTGEAGTVYSASTEDTPSYFDFINQTVESNIATLYTMWTINSYTCTKQYRLQNADGTFPTSYIVDEAETELVEYKSTCTYSKSIADYKSTADGTNDSEAFTSGVMDSTEGITLSLDFYRNTFALTVNRNTTYISSASATTAAVHGTNYYRWGQSISISATASSGNEFTSWSQTAGVAGSFGSTTSASTTFIMPKDDAAIYANGTRSCYSTISGYMQSARVADSYCDGASGTMTDSRDSQIYTVAKINGNLWMTRNLAIGCNGSGSTYGADVSSKSLSNQNSNVSSTWSTPTALLSSITSNTSKEKTYTTPLMQCSATYGAWYNYATTSVETVAGYKKNQDEAQYSICPYGWKLPSIAEFESITEYNDIFKPVTGGWYSNGNNYRKEIGAWWSATASSSYPGYRRGELWYKTAIVAMGDGQTRDVGLYVRCTRSS